MTLKRALESPQTDDLASAIWQVLWHHIPNSQHTFDREAALRLRAIRLVLSEGDAQFRLT